jgi:hypothetical protein
VAILAIFILPDFPATTRSLSPLERKLAQLRMVEDVGEGDEEDHHEGHNQWTGLSMAITDWKVWWLAFALLSQVVSLSFNAYFPSKPPRVSSEVLTIMKVSYPQH